MNKETLYSIKDRCAVAYAVGIGIVVPVAFVLAMVVAPIAATTWLPADYNKAAGSHIRNAVISPTPEDYVSELRQAKAGMQGLGLEPGMYSTLKPWRMTDAHKMERQYELLDAAIARGEAAKPYCNGSDKSHEQLSDVCAQKMENLHRVAMGSECMAEYIDCIAINAYFVKEHRAWEILYEFWVYMAIGLLVLAIPGWVMLADA